MSGWILHWQIASPFGVQGWIAGSRRTRDYWASSFLTSWLSARAMRALVAGGHGRILFPAVESDPLWQAMEDRESDWAIGTLPNRFRAELSDPDAFRAYGADPCTRAARKAWCELAEAVWRTFVEPVAAAGPDTRRIWERQVARFWETSWVVGEDPGDGSDGAWLDRRKNWRTHVATTAEPADHCRIFGDLQELSGRVRARGEREAQDAFWEALRDRVREVVNPGSEDAAFELLELRETERLCAPALVKRLFPCLPAAELDKVLGWIPRGPRQAGRSELPGSIRFWPSTAHVAAVPWMRSAWKEVPDACETFARTVERRSPVEAVAERGSYTFSLASAGGFGSVDGTFFFEQALETEIDNACRHGRKKRAQRLREIAHAAKELRRAYRAKVSPQRRGRQIKAFAPSPFYALLVMDGDGVGRAIGDHGAELSRALAAFGRSVPGFVAEHDGTIIYAGGDDVKALLPLTEAIPCAVGLHRAYLRSVGSLGDGKLTISAGLVFAHFHLPLGSTIREAHHLLDEVAKDGNGRDSIAIAVNKPSGRAAQFVTRFGDRVEKLQELAAKYAREPERSTSFLYRLRDRYGPVLDLFAGRPEELKSLLLAEWLAGSDAAAPERDGDVERVEELIEVCRRVPGPEKGDDGRGESFDIAAGLIARFLADAGVGTLDAGVAAEACG